MLTAGADLRAADPSDRFRHDVYDFDDHSWTARGYYLRLMAMHAATLAAATRTSNPWQTLVRRYPLLAEITHYASAEGCSDPSHAIVSLLSRYSGEWLAFWNVVRHAVAVPA